ncbi:FERM/acyl-CoA-binding protein [Dioscorea alata]|uniref:FERM/acyl-CoA-binding protein n=1 Tax=Dioscorea alata TaxID=55571 RepID=A0ACB7V6R8_DIOAL|nr:FERM/acyl-CoA-binding protein [Dioscorea alata]
MEFLGDLLLSVVVSIAVALLIVVIFAIGDLEHRADGKRVAVVDDLGVDEKLKRSGRESEGEDEIVGGISVDLFSSCVGDAEVLEFNPEMEIEGLNCARAGEVDLEEKNFEVVEGGKMKLEEEEEGEKKKGLMIGVEDDWEGIERSEVVKRFGVACKYSGSADGGMALSKLGGDVRLRLYGLRKVAIEGPCYQPQPMALKVSARAKWQAWQKLGNMNPEVAMEQYINLLSESIPGWMEQLTSGTANKQDSSDSSGPWQSITEKLDVASPLHGKLTSGTDRYSLDIESLCFLMKHSSESFCSNALNFSNG